MAETSTKTVKEVIPKKKAEQEDDELEELRRLEELLDETEPERGPYPNENKRGELNDPDAYQGVHLANNFTDFVFCQPKCEKICLSTIIFELALEYLKRSPETRKLPIYVHAGEYCLRSLHKIDFPMKMIGINQDAAYPVFSTEMGSGFEFAKGSAGLSVKNVSFRTKGATTPAIVMRNSASEFVDCSFQTCPTRKSSGTIVTAYGSSRVTMTRCNFRRGAGGIEMHDNAAGTFSLCSFSGLLRGLRMSDLANVTLETCTLSINPGVAVAVLNGAQLKVDKCHFHDNSFAIDMINRSNCTIKNSKISTSMLRVTDKTKMCVDDCKIIGSNFFTLSDAELRLENNQMEGSDIPLLMKDSSVAMVRGNKIENTTGEVFRLIHRSRIDLIGNTIEKCGKTVLHAEDQATGTMDGNTVNDVKQFAAVASHKASLTITNNTISNAMDGAAHFYNQAKGTMTGNKISDCSRGLWMFDDTQIIAKENEISTCTMGVAASDGGSGEVFNNKITKCKFGIMVYKGSNSTIRKNTVTECSHTGITVTSGGSATIEKNDVSGCRYGMVIPRGDTINIASNNLHDNTAQNLRREAKK